MLKQIPKSDINLRPFKAYKNWEVSSSMDWVTTLTAENHTASADLLTPTELSQKTLYHQLYTMYYRDPNNPFTSYGDIKPTTSIIDAAKQRLLVDRARIIAIPQIKYGEQIKPFSINIYDNQLNESIYDDGHGNLISNYSAYNFKLIDIENKIFIFYDANNNEVTTTILSLDIENNILLVENEDSFFLLTIDIEAGTISFLGVFKAKQFEVPTIGNVFYSHGLIVITKLTKLNEVRENIFNSFSGSYKSTNTIYENEVLLIVGEDEFNTSTNPTAVTFVNPTITSYTTSFEGTQKSFNYDASYELPEFNNYEYSASVDPTGSFIAPYITTIGLYDENMDMVAIAKLATPIKSTPDLPVNFLIRFDT